MTPEEIRDAVEAINFDALYRLAEVYRSDLKRSWENSASTEEREVLFQRLKGTNGFLSFLNVERCKASNPQPMKTRVP